MLPTMMMMMSDNRRGSVGLVLKMMIKKDFSAWHGAIRCREEGGAWSPPRIPSSRTSSDDLTHNVRLFFTVWNSGITISVWFIVKHSEWVSSEMYADCDTKVNCNMFHNVFEDIDTNCKTSIFVFILLNRKLLGDFELDIISFLNYVELNYVTVILRTKLTSSWIRTNNIFNFCLWFWFTVNRIRKI